MIRKSLVALMLSALILATATAETYLEKVVGVDADKKTITIPVNKQDKTFNVDAAAVFHTQIKMGKKLNVSPLKGGIKGIKAKDEIVVTTERKDGEEVVTKVVLIPTIPQPKKK